MIFPLEDEPISTTGQFKQSLDSFFDTDSPSSVTNVAEMAMSSLNNFPLVQVPTGQFK